MTRERFTEIVSRARALLELSGIPALLLTSIDLGLDGLEMDVELAADDPEIKCLVHGVWGRRDGVQAVIHLLDAILPGRRGRSLCEEHYVDYWDDARRVAFVRFTW